MVEPLLLHSLPPALQHCLPARLRQGVAPVQRPATAPASPAGVTSPLLRAASEVG